MVVSLAVDGEAIFRGPVEDGLAAAAQHGDVQRAHLDLLQHDGRARLQRPPGEGEVEDRGLRVRLAEEPLERPPSALFDFLRDRG